MRLRPCMDAEWRKNSKQNIIQVGGKSSDNFGELGLAETSTHFELDTPYFLVFRRTGGWCLMGKSQPVEVTLTGADLGLVGFQQILMGGSLVATISREHDTYATWVRT